MSALRSLFPPTGDDADAVDPSNAVATEDRPPPPHRPWVMTNMITSADGATAVDGVSGPLGGPPDLAVFMALRSISDAIVVGAATVRAERYRMPGAGTASNQAARAARGQAARPLLVVVTASLSLPDDLPLFDDPGQRPLVATTASSPPERRASLASRAEIIEVGEQRVELPLLMEELHRRGVGVILAEGGPSLNAQLIADDLIDEWNLTISPLLAAGGAKRPAQGSELKHPAAPMELQRVWLADDLLFCRWTRTRAG